MLLKASSAILKACNWLFFKIAVHDLLQAIEAGVHACAPFLDEDSLLFSYCLAYLYMLPVPSSTEPQHLLLLRVDQEKCLCIYV